MFLSQQKYALEIINECGLLRAEHAAFAIKENHKLALANRALIHDASRCRWITRRLIYLIITWPDLS